MTFSFTLDSSKYENNFGWVPLISGLAVARAINNYVEKEIVELKWPNDLLIDGKKLAGILSEKNEKGLIVGIGINVYQTQDELPIADAISLSMKTEVDRSELLIAILNELGAALNNIDAEKNNYRKRCVTIGKQVSATLPTGEVIHDLASGISNEGALLLNTREIRVGDIVHLR